MLKLYSQDMATRGSIGPRKCRRLNWDFTSDSNQCTIFNQAVKLNVGNADPLINSTLNSETEQEEPVQISKPLQLCSCLVFLSCSILCYFSHGISLPSFQNHCYLLQLSQFNNLVNENICSKKNTNWTEFHTFFHKYSRASGVLSHSKRQAPQILR